MACEALGDGVTASTWGSHGTSKIDVHYVLECPCGEQENRKLAQSIYIITVTNYLTTELTANLTYLFPVIPASMVHPLPQQFNRRLSTIRLQHGHV